MSKYTSYKAWLIRGKVNKTKYCPETVFYGSKEELFTIFIIAKQRNELDFTKKKNLRNIISSITFLELYSV